MLRAERMHVDRRSAFGETPRRAGMIEVNVTEENVPNILCRKPGFAKIDNYVVERRFGARIKKSDAVIGFDGGCGNNAGPTELTGIEDVEHIEATSGQPSLKSYGLASM
jgi:hypothetical protein